MGKGDSYDLRTRSPIFNVRGEGQLSESKITTWIAFSCPHVPLQCDAAIDWMLGQISDLSPDVIIHLGDGHEADSASRWPSEYDWSLEDEFVGHNN